MAKEQTLDERIIEKRKELRGMGNVIALYADKSAKLAPEDKQEVENEQFRLEFRLKTLEEQGLNLKIAAYKKVIDILKTKSHVF